LHDAKHWPRLGVLNVQGDCVDIRLISSLTDDDEDRFASVLMKAMDDLLCQLSVAYHLRIDTTGGTVLQRSRSSSDVEDVEHHRELM